LPCHLSNELSGTIQFVNTISKDNLNMQTKLIRTLAINLLRGMMVSMLLVGMLGFPPAGAVHAAVGTIRYVKAFGFTSGTCDSWANACDLQYALGVAVSGDEIWVASGTYYPTTYTDRNATFVLIDGVSIIGGFFGTDGTEGDINQRDPNPGTNATILSGDIGIPGDTSDNSYHVVTGGGTGSSAELDGFTIMAGNANLLVVNGTDQYGGGIFNEGGSPTLSNLIFRGKHSRSTVEGCTITTAAQP
jgi:hypothetical protein